MSGRSLCRRTGPQSVQEEERVVPECVVITFRLATTLLWHM